MIVLFASILLAAIVAGTRETRARNSALLAWGQHYGLTMVDPVAPSAGWFSSRPSVDPKRWADLKALKGLPSGSAQNFQEGRLEGRRARVFDTWYVVSAGKTTVTVYHGVVALDLGKSVPGFALRKHNLWDSLVALFGARDIEIGFEEFDRAFHVSGDEAFLKSFLDREVVAVIGKAQVDAVACTGASLVLVRAKQCDVEELDAILMTALLLARKIDA